MPRPLKVIDHSANVVHPCKDSVSLKRSADVVIVRRPDLQKDSQAVPRMEEGDRAPRFVGSKLFRRRGDLLYARRAQMGYIVHDIIGMETDVVESADAPTIGQEPPRARILANWDIELQLHRANGNVQNVRGVRTALLVAVGQRRSRSVDAQSKAVGKDALRRLQIGNGEPRVVDAIKHIYGISLYLSY
jgi:hypothetical protein